MSSWVGELFCRVWILVFWAGAYNSSFILLHWAAIQGESLSRIWSADVGGVTTLGGGATVVGVILVGVTTLGGGTVGEVMGVVSGAGVGATRNGI